MYSYLFIFILIIFPIVLSAFFDCKMNDYQKTNEDFICLFKIMTKVVYYLFIIFGLKIILIDKVTKGNVQILFLNVIYYFSFISLFVFVNFFSTRYIEFRKCIKLFLTETIKFVEENFIFNIIFLGLIIFTEKDESIFKGLIGAYIFFALTGIHSEYKKKKEKIKYEKEYKVIQIILNVAILFYFTIIEQVIIDVSNNNLIIFDYTYYIIILFIVIAIILNSFWPNIYSACLKYKKNK